MKFIDGFLDTNVHYKWDNKIPAIELVSSGELITISIPDSSTKQLKRNYGTAELKRIDDSMIEGLVGPIYVQEVCLGDTLRISIKKIIPGDWDGQPYFLNSVCSVRCLRIF